MGLACPRMGGVRKACKSFLSKHHFGKKSTPKNKDKHLQVDDVNNDNIGDGDGDGDGDVSPRPKVTSPRFSRNASTGFLPSSLPKTSSQRRSKTPCRIRPVNSLLRSFSRKSMDSNSTSFHTAPSASASVSRRNSSTIIYSNANGLRKPPDMVKRLECTLEELCFGINVKPGWRKGTKVTFEGMGNETPGACAADITFVVDQKRHPVFKRNGDDLEVGVEVPLVDALTGCTLTIPFLDGQQSCLMIDDVIAPGYRKTIAGEGMTLPKEEGKRGNLNIKFSVEFPQQLTEEQRSECFNILQQQQE